MDTGKWYSFALDFHMINYFLSLGAVFLYRKVPLQLYQTAIPRSLRWKLWELNNYRASIKMQFAHTPMVMVVSGISSVIPSHWQNGHMKSYHIWKPTNIWKLFLQSSLCKKKLNNSFAKLWVSMQLPETWWYYMVLYGRITCGLPFRAVSIWLITGFECAFLSIIVFLLDL